MTTRENAMAKTFAEIIAILEEAKGMVGEATQKFDEIKPKLEECKSMFDVGGTVSENATDLINGAMAGATPEDMENAKLAILATGVLAFTAQVQIDKVIKNGEDCITNMNDAFTSLATYIGKIT
jgi:hypothetical protein